MKKILHSTALCFYSILLLLPIGLHSNIYAGKTQEKISQKSKSYCDSDAYPVPQEIMPNYYKYDDSLHNNLKYEIKGIEPPERTIQQYRVRARLYFIDSSQIVIFGTSNFHDSRQTSYYRLLFGDTENLDSLYGSCTKSFIGRTEKKEGLEIGKKYWLLIERQPTTNLYYSGLTEMWQVGGGTIPEVYCIDQPLHESHFYCYYIKDWGECK